MSCHDWHTVDTRCRSARPSILCDRSRQLSGRAHRIGERHRRTSIAPQIERTWRRGVVKKARRDGSLIVQVQLREGERPGPGDREVGGHAELGGLVVLRKCTLGQVVLDKTGAVGRMEPLCLVVDRRDPGARGRA